MRHKLKGKKISIVIMCVLLVAALVSCGAKQRDGGHYAPGEMSPGVGDTAADSGNTYTEIVENAFEDVTEENYRSMISLSVNTASYSDVRRQILSGNTVNKNAVKIEEMVNYFSYDYAAPEEGKPLSLAGAMIDTPWNANTKLLTVGLKAEEIDRGSTVNNIVLLIDTSGSMYGADRLGLVVESFCLLVDQLTQNDTVSVVTYASGQRVVLDGVTGDNKLMIKAALTDLSAGGSTAGGAAINKAYEIAFKHDTAENESSIIIATDGDFNVGVSDKEQLKALISENSRKGVHLSAIGVGMGNMRSDMLETIADAGDGQHMYFNGYIDAKKFFVEELGGVLNVVATDGKAQIEFNRDVVSQYRLIGYENRQLSLDQWDDWEEQAGVIGSGTEVTAMYEIVLKDGVTPEDFAKITVRYKDSEKVQCEDTITLSTRHYNPTAEDDATVIKQHDRAFIASVIEFGLLLRNSKYMGTASYNSVYNRLNTLQCTESDEYKKDFKALVELMK